MALNPLIPMQVQSLDFGQAGQNALQGYQVADQAQNNALIRDQREQQMTREQADFAAKDMVQDAVLADQVFKSGDYRQLDRLLKEREAKILQRGGDPSDTVELRGRLLAGDVDGVRSGLDTVLNFGRQTGLLSQPEGFNLSPGQVRFGPDGRPVAAVPAAQRSGKTQEQIDRELSISEEANNIRRDELGFRIEQGGQVKLTPTTIKILDEAQTTAFKSGGDARELELLATDLQALDIGGGVGSTTSEKLKQLTGSQEAVSDLRRRFRAFRASQAVNNLPPGVASDKDIELALSGFPPENANNNQIRSFLTGQAKLARLNEGYNLMKADYISQKGSTAGLAKDWREKLESKEFQSQLFQNIEGIESAEDTGTSAVYNQGGAQALPQGVTEEDVQFTAQKYNLSREEVIQRLRGQ